MQMPACFELQDPDLQRPVQSSKGHHSQPEAAAAVLLLATDASTLTLNQVSRPAHYNVAIHSFWCNLHCQALSSMLQKVFLL
jgi:hypothetical protein